MRELYKTYLWDNDKDLIFNLIAIYVFKKNMNEII